MTGKFPCAVLICVLISCIIQGCSKNPTSPDTHPDPGPVQKGQTPSGLSCGIQNGAHPYLFLSWDEYYHADLAGFQIFAKNKNDTVMLGASDFIMDLAGYYETCQMYGTGCDITPLYNGYAAWADSFYTRLSWFSTYSALKDDSTRAAAADSFHNLMLNASGRIPSRVYLFFLSNQFLVAGGYNSFSIRAVYVDSSFSGLSAWATVAIPDSIFAQWSRDAFPSDIYFNGGAMAFPFDSTAYSYNLDVPGPDTSFSFSVSLKSNQTCYFRLGAGAPDWNGHYSGKLDTGSTNLTIVVFAENGRDSVKYQIHLYKPADVPRDPYENDNTQASASVLLVNGPPQNRTLTYNDTDWMAINITKDTTYRITTASQGILISCFALTAGGYYLFSAPAEDSSLNRAAYFTAETTGTCYLEVMQAAEWPPVLRQGAYTIAISTTPNPGEPDSNIQAAQPITVNGDSLYRTLTPQDVDWFYFTALSGKQYRIKSDNAPVIRMYDSTGTGYIAAAIGGGIDWDCTASGKYLLKVGDNFYTENFFYRIWIYSAP